MLPLIAVLGACNDDLEIANGEVTIKVNDDGITSPQWLVEVVDSVAHRYSPSPTRASILIHKYILRNMNRKTIS